MTTPRDPDRIFASWMAEGPETLRDEVLTTVTADLGRNRQRRGLHRRIVRLPLGLRAAGAVGATVLAVGVVAAGLGALGGLRGLPSTGGPGPVPSASPSPAASTPAPSPVTASSIESRVYPYTWSFAASDVAIAPGLATSRWDGATPCIAQDACTDWIVLHGDPGVAPRTIWVFGTPTDRTLDAFAADVQRQTSTWRPCASAPDTTRDLVLDGVPARLHAFTCTSDGGTDLHLRVFAVRDGVGLVIAMARLSSGEAVDREAEIERLVGHLERFRWAP